MSRKQIKMMDAIDRMIEHLDDGLSGFWYDPDDGECANLKIFPELSGGGSMKHTCCPYDSLLLYGISHPDLVNSGCFRRCLKNRMTFASKELQKEVLERFKMNCENHVYDSKPEDFPPLLSETEQKSLNKKITDMIRKSEEEYEKQKKIYEKTLKEKWKHLIVFFGNNLNPLPQELFLLWKNLIEKYKRELSKQWERETQDRSRFEILYYDEETNTYENDWQIFWDAETQCFSPNTSTVGLSLYFDHELKEERFCLIFLTNGEEIPEDFYVRNMMILPAYKYLKQIYQKWKRIRKEETEKWIQQYVPNRYQQMESVIHSLNQVICEVCHMSDSCPRTFCMLPDSMKRVVTIPREEQYKVNLHILEPCNYRCRHCFAHFDNHKVLPVNVWKHIVDNCAAGIYTYEFNIAGGEPLLYKDLPELARYIRSFGYGCSLITNGYLMTDDWIEQNAPLFTTIGFSIDSFEPKTLITMGRKTSTGDYLSKERFQEICRKIKEVNPNCKLKANSVVTSLNQQEELCSILNELPINKWKIIKMRVFSNNSFDNSDIQITDEEYQEFVERNIRDCTLEQKGDSEKDSDLYRSKQGMQVVIEKDVQGAYIIIDANGYLIDNSEGTAHEVLIDCKTERFQEGFKKLSLDKELYFSRYK